MLLLVDPILTNSSNNISQPGVIVLGLSDHDLIYCTRKTSSPKPHKHNEIFIPSMKKYSAKRYFKIVREIDCFPKHLTHACVNYAYSDSIYRFVVAINCIAPAKTIRVKANLKPWFDKQIISKIG